MSDLYAMGVVDVDKMLILIGVSEKMTDLERDVVMPLIVQGFAVSVLNGFKFELKRYRKK